MNKIAIPVLLAGIIMIAGIFAFMPIEEAITVHLTLQTSTAANTAHDLLQTTSASTTQTTNIQNTQLNNVNSTFQTDMSANVTVGCGSSGGGFLIFYTFSNASANGVITQLGINDPSFNASDSDGVITLAIGNQTTISGVVAGTTGENVTFYGNSTGKGFAADTTSTFEDTGDLVLTVQCQSGSTPVLLP